MTITKYGHACLLIEKNSQKIIIDPGGLTKLPEDVSGIAAIVITHNHFDHLYTQNIATLVAANPNIVMYGVQSAIDECSEFESEKRVIRADQVETIGEFEVSFYFGKHAIIYQKSPCDNIGIKIDNELYYPGDSLRTIDDAVRVVAVPICAPWLKSSEYIEFVQSMNPEIALPTHDGLVNSMGLKTFNGWLEKGLEGTGTVVTALMDGEQIHEA